MITALLDLMGSCFQAGNPGQMAAIARAILTAIPKDIVALHFLGLALYQMGHTEAARRAFGQACARPPRRRKSDQMTTTGEEAAMTILREASTPASGLGEAWRHIARAMSDLGFRREALRAYRTSLVARGLAGISIRGENPVTSAVPTMTTAAPTRVCQPTASARNSQPQSTPKSGIRNVTVSAGAAPMSPIRRK